MLKSTKYLFDWDMSVYKSSDIRYYSDTWPEDKEQMFDDMPEVSLDVDQVESLSFIKTVDYLEIHRKWFKEYAYTYEKWEGERYIDAYEEIPLSRIRKLFRCEPVSKKIRKRNPDYKRVFVTSTKSIYALFSVYVNFKNGTQQIYYCGECDIPQVTKFLTNKETPAKKKK